MTKILILNGWSKKGNRALVDSTIEAIKTFVQDAELNLIGLAIRKNFWSCSDRYDSMWIACFATYIELKIKRSLIFLRS